MEKLYSIKQAAVAAGVTPRTLRYYEELGLLDPKKVDKTTGYRYYSIQNIVSVVLILTLKDSGMPLGHIAEHLSGRASIENTIERLLAQKEAIDRSIAMLETYHIAGNQLKPEVVTVAERLCIVKSVVAKDFADAYALCSEFLEQCILTGKCVIRKNHSFAEFPPEAFNETGLIQNNFPMRICVPVDVDKPPKGAVVYPAITGIAVNYRGAYDGLGTAYDTLYSFMQQHNLIQNGNPQEYYLECEGNTNFTANNYITRVIIPVK